MRLYAIMYSRKESEMKIKIRICKEDLEPIIVLLVCGVLMALSCVGLIVTIDEAERYDKIRGAMTDIIRFGFILVVVSFLNLRDNKRKRSAE